MKKTITLIVRIFFGLGLAVSGLNGLLQFLPLPEPQGAAADFMGGLIGSGYFFEFVKLTEIICGLLLIAGIFVPLALVILAPIVLNIILFHVFLDPGGLGAPIFLLLLGVYLAWSYRDSFRGVLELKAQPR